VSRDDQRPPQPQRQQTGLSFRTLLISSLAAAAAAVVVPIFWERGSVLATAITPIVVAIVSEALNRQANAITSVTPRVTRRTGTGAAVRSEQPAGVGARGDGPERVTRWNGTDDDPFGLRTDEPPRRRNFPWRLAIGTGMLAALIGAAVVTASELAVFGHSVAHSGRSTSVFGGSRAATPTPSATATPTPSSTAEKATPTPTDTASPVATGTPPGATATVTGTAVPNTAQGTPPPAETPGATPAPTEAPPVPTP
jgi:hypothetical protein